MVEDLNFLFEHNLPTLNRTGFKNCSIFKLVKIFGTMHKYQDW